MSLMDIIKRRYSCRNYESKEVEQDKLDKILEAARLAPSAKNLQDWRFVAVTEQATKSRLASVTNRPEVFEKAGVILAACSNNADKMTCGQKIGPIDVSIALEHIALQATELGLATCWIGSFDAEEVAKTLQIPDDIEIIQLMALGYPADDPKAADRQPLEDIVCYNKWQF